MYSLREIEKIRKRTGFELEIAPDVYETPPPSAGELELLRTRIDPLGIRELDRMSGSRRRRKMREIIQIEAKARRTLPMG